MAASKLFRDTNIIHRFSDVARELCIMWEPIEGFSNKPLVLLEEAVEPLISIVRDVKKKVTIVKESAKTPSHNLTLDESGSISLYTLEWEPYTDSLYYILNSALRNEDRNELKPWLLYLKLILTALSHLHSIRLPVYRSLKWITEIENERYQEGKEIVWWGFSSCTLNKNISQKDHFLSSTGTRTLFIIDCLQGKDIGLHSWNKNDQEVLLLPGTRFKVVRCDRRRDDLHKIYLKEVVGESVLLEPVFTMPADQTLTNSSPTTNTQSTRREFVQRFLHRPFTQKFKH